MIFAFASGKPVEIPCALAILIPYCRLSIVQAIHSHSITYREPFAV